MYGPVRLDAVPPSPLAPPVFSHVVRGGTAVALSFIISVTASVAPQDGGSGEPQDGGRALEKPS